LLRAGTSDDSAQLIFPAKAHPKRSVSGFSKWKKRLDDISGVRDWRLHDIRRTVATMLAEQKCPPHVIGKILNHGGAISGPTRIYVHHDYVDEARAALTEWEKYLTYLMRSVPNSSLT
jgi:integrase